MPSLDYNHDLFQNVSLPRQSADSQNDDCKSGTETYSPHDQTSSMRKAQAIVKKGSQDKMQTQSYLHLVAECYRLLGSPPYTKQSNRCDEKHLSENLDAQNSDKCDSQNHPHKRENPSFEYDPKTQRVTDKHDGQTIVGSSPNSISSKTSTPSQEDSITITRNTSSASQGYLARRTRNNNSPMDVTRVLRPCHTQGDVLIDTFARPPSSRPFSTLSGSASPFNDCHNVPCSPFSKPCIGQSPTALKGLRPCSPFSPTFDPPCTTPCFESCPSPCSKPYSTTCPTPSSKPNCTTCPTPCSKPFSTKCSTPCTKPNCTTYPTPCSKPNYTTCPTPCSKPFSTNCSTPCSKPFATKCSTPCSKPNCTTCPTPCLKPFSTNCSTPCSKPFSTECFTPCSKPNCTTCPTPCSKPNCTTCPTPCSKPNCTTCPTPCSKPFSTTCPMPCSKPFSTNCLTPCSKPNCTTCPTPCSKPNCTTCPTPCSRPFSTKCSTPCSKPYSTSSLTPCSKPCFDNRPSICSKPCSPKCPPMRSLSDCSIYPLRSPLSSCSPKCRPSYDDTCSTNCDFRRRRPPTVPPCPSPCSPYMPCGECSKCRFLTSYQATYGSPRNSPEPPCSPCGPRNPCRPRPRLDPCVSCDPLDPCKPRSRLSRLSAGGINTCQGARSSSCCPYSTFCLPWNLCSVCRHMPPTQGCAKGDVKSVNTLSCGCPEKQCVCSNRPTPCGVSFSIPYKDKETNNAGMMTTNKCPGACLDDANKDASGDRRAKLCQTLDTSTRGTALHLRDLKSSGRRSPKKCETSKCAPDSKSCQNRSYRLSNSPAKMTTPKSKNQHARCRRCTKSLCKDNNIDCTVNFEVKDQGVLSKTRRGNKTVTIRDGRNSQANQRFRTSVGTCKEQSKSWCEDSLPCKEQSKSWCEDSLLCKEQSKSWCEDSLPCKEQSKFWCEDSLPCKEQSKSWCEDSLPCKEQSKPWCKDNIPCREQSKSWRKDTLPCKNEDKSWCDDKPPCKQRNVSWCEEKSLRNEQNTSWCEDILPCKEQSKKCFENMFPRKDHSRSLCEGKFPHQKQSKSWCEGRLPCKEQGKECQSSRCPKFTSSQCGCDSPGAQNCEDKPCNQQKEGQSTHQCPWEADITVTGSVRGHCTSTAVEIANCLTGKFQSCGERLVTKDDRECEKLNSENLNLRLCLPDGSFMNFSRNQSPTQENMCPGQTRTLQFSPPAKHGREMLRKSASRECSAQERTRFDKTFSSRDHQASWDCCSSNATYTVGGNFESSSCCTLMSGITDSYADTSSWLMGSGDRTSNRCSSSDTIVYDRRVERRSQFGRYAGRFRRRVDNERYPTSVSNIRQYPGKTSGLRDQKYDFQAQVNNDRYRQNECLQKRNISPSTHFNASRLKEQLQNVFRPNQSFSNKTTYHFDKPEYTQDDHHEANIRSRQCATRQLYPKDLCRKKQNCNPENGEYGSRSGQSNDDITSEDDSVEGSEGRKESFRQPHDHYRYRYLHNRNRYSGLFNNRKEQIGRQGKSINVDDNSDCGIYDSQFDEHGDSKHRGNCAKREFRHFDDQNQDKLEPGQNNKDSLHHQRQFTAHRKYLDYSDNHLLDKSEHNSQNREHFDDQENITDNKTSLYWKYDNIRHPKISGIKPQMKDGAYVSKDNRNKEKGVMMQYNNENVTLRKNSTVTHGPHFKTHLSNQSVEARRSARHQGQIIEQSWERHRDESPTKRATPSNHLHEPKPFRGRLSRRVREILGEQEKLLNDENAVRDHDGDCKGAPAARSKNEYNQSNNEVDRFRNASNHVEDGVHVCACNESEFRPGQNRTLSNRKHFFRHHRDNIEENPKYIVFRHSVRNNDMIGSERSPTKHKHSSQQKYTTNCGIKQTHVSETSKEQLEYLPV